MKSPIFKGATTVTWGIIWGNMGLPYNMGQFGDYGPKKAVFGQNFENHKMGGVNNLPRVVKFSKNGIHPPPYN